MVQKGFKCFDLDGTSESESSCAFGSSGFNTTKSPTFKTDAGTNFNISYGDGEYLTGSVGYDTVTVAGMAAKSQKIGVVNKAAWYGDSVTSGLMGLANPYITSVYGGTDPNADSTSNHLTYDPYFYTAVKEKMVANPYFSVALNRGSFAAQESSTLDEKLGYIAFGGIAPVKTTSNAATVPMQGYIVSDGSKQLAYYTVNVTSYNFSGADKLSQKNNQAILDTGTTLNYLPPNIAREYNAKFSPKATLQDGYYYVDCDAKVPAFSVTIGGKKFTVDGKDNVVPGGTDENGNEVCYSGVQDGYSFGIYILGDVFLHNVVSTFNIDTKRITLTSRASY